MSNIEIETNAPPSPHFVESHDAAGLEHPAGPQSPWLATGETKSTYYRRLAAERARPPLTPARLALKALIDDKAALNDLIAANRASAARLATALSAEQPLAVALDALDRAEAESMSLWAASGDCEMPASDLASRQELTAKLAMARAQGDAARRATEALDAEYTRHTEALARIAGRVDDAALVVLAESAAPIIAELHERTNEVASLTEKLALLAEILNPPMMPVVGAHGDVRMTRGPSHLLADLVDKVKSAATADPQLDSASQARLAWTNLAANLKTDSNSRLES